MDDEINRSGRWTAEIITPPPSPHPHTPHTPTHPQPSSDLYAKFDQLMLLVSGRVVYYGEAAVALRYFQALGALCVCLVGVIGGVVVGWSVGLVGGWDGRLVGGLVWFCACECWVGVIGRVRCGLVGGCACLVGLARGFGNSRGILYGGSELSFIHRPSNETLHPPPPTPHTGLRCPKHTNPADFFLSLCDESDEPAPDSDPGGAYVCCVVVCVRACVRVCCVVVCVYM